MKAVWQLFVTLMCWVGVWLDCLQIDSVWTGEWTREWTSVTIICHFDELSSSLTGLFSNRFRVNWRVTRRDWSRVSFLSKGLQFTSVEATFALNEPFYQKPSFLTYTSKNWWYCHVRQWGIDWKKTKFIHFPHALQKKVVYQCIWQILRDF